MYSQDAYKLLRDDNKELMLLHGSTSENRSNVSRSDQQQGEDSIRDFALCGWFLAGQLQCAINRIYALDKQNK